IRSRLEESRHSCPLFDTQRWVRNMELSTNPPHDNTWSGRSRLVWRWHTSDSRQDLTPKTSRWRTPSAPR
ncbi:unnamed protein product, partial [Ectocarpus sp. 8 AP-2014]